MKAFYNRDTAPVFPEQSLFLDVPKQIGPYQIESALKKGGMSQLYLGRKDSHSPLIVIKVLLEEYLHQDDAVRRFLKEASLISQTSHPNIIELYGQGKWERGLYIAMEFVQGISLRQFIEEKTLSKKKAVEIVLNIAQALSHLHSNGIIHRDLKPENILITEEGQIKVIDFGISQLINSAQKTVTMQRSQLMGTPMYMSPEQLNDPPHVNFSSDLYSLGLIAYELLLGRLSHGVVQAALLPTLLRPIIERTLEFEVTKRYQKVEELIEDLEKAVKKGPCIEETDFAVKEIRNIWDKLYSEVPQWPQTQWGAAKKDGQLSYLDFLSLEKQNYLVAFAEPLSIEKGTVFSLSGLRSSVRLALSKGKLADGVESINEMILKDPFGQPFSFFFLFLSCEKNQLDFIASDDWRLYRIPSDSETIRTLSCSNSLIGSKETTFSYTTDHWNIGDQCAITSKKITEKDVQEKKFYALTAMSEHLLKDSTFTLTSQRNF